MRLKARLMKIHPMVWVTLLLVIVMGFALILAIQSHCKKCQTQEQIGLQEEERVCKKAGYRHHGWIRLSQHAHGFRCKDDLDRLHEVVPPECNSLQQKAAPCREIRTLRHQQHTSTTPKE